MKPGEALENFIIGDSEPIRALRAQIARVVSVNVCAVAEHRFEAHFFGLTRHALTGARTALPAFVREADHGTLFLDEVGSLSLGNQATLLRVQQEQTVRRVGASADLQSEFRLVSATNDDVVALAARGKLRGTSITELALSGSWLPPYGSARGTCRR